MRATDDGEPRYVSTGSQYISLRHRLFFAGTDTTVYTDETYENDQTPVAFVYPGEPGFFPNRPSFGCGAEDARFDR